MGAYTKDLSRRVGEYLRTKSEPPLPSDILENLFEILFFASLQREEAHPISCRIALVGRGNPDPDPPRRVVADRWSYYPLAKELPLTVDNLVKLAQAVDPWGSTLAVDADDAGKLRIWGLIDQSVHFSTYLVKEAETGPEMPGIFQAAIHGVGEISVYKRDVLIAELKRDVLVTRQHRVFQHGPVYKKLLPWIEKYRKDVVKIASQEAYESRDHWDDSLEDFWVSALCRLLIGIHRYGHGGAVLISDRTEGLTPKYSIEYPRLADSLTRLGAVTIDKTFYSDKIMEEFVEGDAETMPVDLYLDETVASDKLEDIRNELKGTIRFLTSLSRVDGLLWLTSALRLRAFGVEIAREDDPPQVLRALDTEGSKSEEVDIRHFGMRHRSMIRYCGFNPDAVGFVVSQDGGLKAITRVGDAVLIWDRVRVHSIRTPKIARPHKR